MVDGLRQADTFAEATGIAVLILVVMVDGLRHMFILKIQTGLQVLILVVMVDGLRPRSVCRYIPQVQRLNPCCNGRWSQTENV